MLRINVNGGFLDLAKDSSLELERNSPFFIDNVLAEFTMPITIKFTNNNVKLLGNVFFEYTVKTKISYPVNVFDGTTFRYTGLLTITATNFDANNRAYGDVQGFIQNGLSVFVNEVKKRKLRDLSFGGKRPLNFTSWDALDGSNGYIQHFQKTWEYQSDYVVVPCRNDIDYFPDGWMNKVGSNGGLEIYFFTHVFLFPKLSYTLHTMFKELGWILDDSELPDSWKSIVLFSAYGHAMNMISDAATSIEIDVSKLYSPEVTVPDFLTAICRRYGWAPLFNSNSRVCKIVPFKKVISGKGKDFSKYAHPASSDDFSEDGRVFGWKNNFTGNDSAISNPSFNGKRKGEAVLTKAMLPEPASFYDYVVIYVYQENQYFEVVFDEVANSRKWVVFSDNIYDESTDSDTYVYETSCTTLPVYRSEFRVSNGTTYYGKFPYCKQNPNDNWGIRTLLWCGLAKEQNSEGGEGAIQYAMCSSLGLHFLGGRVVEFSNVYSHKDPIIGVDYGIVNYWFKEFIDAVGYSPVTTRKFNLPLHELMQLQFDDTVLIRSVPYLVSKITEPIPYKGLVEMELRRIKFGKETAVNPVAKLYVRTERENVVFHASYTVTVGAFSTTYTNATTADTYLAVYLDPECTLPAVPSLLSVSVGRKVNQLPSYDKVITLNQQRTFINQTNFDAPPYPGSEIVKGTYDDIYLGLFTFENVYIVNASTDYIAL